ncbi:hypothetical protein BVC80_8983g27 [Macleaya cordata]|uniref:BRI1 kinase inhibitor 1 n=1 Tax=Macleaya cordata TaxID=56857 RepID=A0A200QJ40_MACCD|nr:hypothetical protein BVC80_8983g27 [Macleaya cordata]
MDTQQPQMKKEREEEEEKSKPAEPKELGQSTKKPTELTTITCSSSPPSPSHEFSFTISLQPSSTNSLPDKTNSSSPPSFAIDLSPADEIFFHGHLLPLHLLSHLPISPRSSTNSFGCSTPPIKDVLEDQKPTTNNNNNCNNNSSSNDQYHSNSGGTKKRIKVKSFSLFSPAKWRKQCEIGNREEENDDETTKKKVRFDASHILKRYLRMVRPLLFFRGRTKNCQLQMKTHSFSSNSNFKGKQEQSIRRNSAPASMQTSATNSGSLAKVKFPSSIKDSSMEELQSAIEAAIAHCKSSSTAKEEKLKFQY